MSSTLVLALVVLAALLVALVGWLLLRAWNDGSDPEVLDIYPYATTSPIYLDLPGALPADPADAAYFVTWLDRAIADAAARTDYRDSHERNAILDYLRKARARYAEMAKRGKVVDALGLEPRTR